MCRNQTCNNADAWILIKEKSQFVDFQKLRIQENSHEIPAGSVPRRYKHDLKF